jgi:hypothetical protein
MTIWPATLGSGSLDNPLLPTHAGSCTVEH